MCVFCNPIVEVKNPMHDVLEADKLGDFSIEADIIANEDGGDAPADTTTPYTMLVGETFEGSLETLGDRDWVAISLEAGTDYQIDLTGTGLSGEIGDTYLRLYDANGNLIDENDDFVGVFSQLTFTPSTSGTFFLSAGAFSDGEIGNYLLSVVEDTSVPPVNTPGTDETSGDAASDTTTPYSVAVGGQFEGRLGLAGDRDWVAVELVAGQFYEIDLFGVGGDAVPDTYLRLYDANGNLIAENDDANGLNSELIFQATETGTYFISAGGFDDQQVGDYVIEVQETVAPPPPVLTDVIEWQDGSFAITNIEVSFMDFGTEVLDEGTAIISDGFTQAQQDAIIEALDYLSNITNLEFTYSNNNTDADIRLATDDLGAGLLGYMYPQNTTNSSDGLGVLTSDPTYWNTEGTEVGGFMYGVIIHELGHGLGLAHTHDTGGGSDILSGVSSSSDLGDYGNMNQSVYTVMSYNDGWQDHPLGLPTGQGSGYMASFGALDIAVLQSYYGVDTSFAAGDDTYFLGDDEFYMTIWDAGGTDEVVVTSAAGSNVDLRAASLEFAAGGAGRVSYANDLRGGFTIANGVVIENATGGSGDDDIIGNSAANTLSGAGGGDILLGLGGRDRLNGGADNDVLNGGGGDDTLFGGTGVDYAIYANAFADYAITVGSDHLLIAGQGTDFVSDDIELFTFDDGDYTYAEVIAALDAGADNTFDGTSAADTLVGTSAEDLIRGFGNRDLLQGLGGNDTIEGGNGVDTIQGGGGDDSLLGDIGGDSINGGYGNDTLFGGGGADILTEAGGNDTLFGGLDGDRLNGGSGNDTLYGGDGRDELRAGTGDDTAYGDSGNDLIGGGDGGDVVYGGDGNDFLYGNADDDTMEGGAGDDRLYGGTGNDFIEDLEITNDSLYGGIGDDTIAAGDGDDRGFGGTGNDYIDLEDGNDFGNGGAGNDSLFGGFGNDTLAGAGGDDYLEGGEGDDILNGFSGDDRIFDFGLSNDTLYGGVGNDTLEAVEGLNTLYGGSGDDTLTGGFESDTLYGGSGNDQIVDSGSFDDVIYGGTGDDTIFSFEANDTIFGGSGADVIEVESGQNVLTGGAGADIFRFTDFSESNTITDFTDGVDRLDFTSNGYTLSDFTITQVGSDVQLVSNIDSNQIVLIQNFQVSDLDSSDLL